jgi:hypothetical protein
MLVLNLVSATPYPVGPECLAPAPRWAELTRKARIVRGVLLAVLLLLPSLLLVTGYSGAATLRDLVAHGRSETGRVTAKPTPRRSRSGTTYRIQYVYEINGQVYHGDDQVSEPFYAALAEGSPLKVTYLPTDPQTHCLGRAEQWLQARNNGTIATAAFVGLTLGSAWAFVVFRLRRELRLARLGQAVVGLVISSGSSRGKGGPTYWTRYQCASPLGYLAEGWNYVPHVVWQRLPPGTPVTILCDPDHPRRHRPLYAFGNVRFLPDE